MDTGVDAFTLNRQPQQRRTVYAILEAEPEGRSVKQLLTDSGVPETDLRDTLRKLEAAGLVRRSRAVWMAVPLDTPPSA
jgi:DNA-binding MarR family transcriptional regulator